MRSAVRCARRLDWRLLFAPLLLVAAVDWRGASAPPVSAPGSPETQRSAERDDGRATSASLESRASLLEQRRALLASLGVDRMHAAGQRGRGVKIAVLDSGFRGYRGFLGKGLPQAVRARSFRQDRDLESRDSQHGILCAEILHTLAPEAELLFANWEPDAPDSFLAAVAWAKSEGARIVSCSIIIPHWSDGEGGGLVHQGLEPLIGRGSGSGDLVFVASAGNIAQRHWTGSLAPDGRGHHQWSAGKTLNGLAPWGNERIAVEFCGATDFELEVIERTSGVLIGKSRPDGPDGQDPAGPGHAVVRFDPAPGESYAVRLVGLGNQGVRRMPREGTAEPTPGPGVGFTHPTKAHLTVLGANLEHFVVDGSIPFPGDGAAVLTVGAVDEELKRARYSSCGPNSKQPKPDLVARVPFPSLCRDRPFTGTSAAAPQAAALAALLQSRNPGWSATQVRDALRSAALDLHVPGHDFETGHGLLRVR